MAEAQDGISGLHSACEGNLQVPPRPIPSDDQPQSEQDKPKTARILEACSNRDIKGLAELASSERGLVDDQSRRRACKVPQPVNRLLRLLISNRAIIAWLRAESRGMAARLVFSAASQG